MTTDRSARLVLLTLLDGEVGWSRLELAGQLEVHAAVVDDAVGQLRRAGLVHNGRGLVSATRAAVECDRLLGRPI